MARHSWAPVAVLLAVLVAGAVRALPAGRGHESDPTQQSPEEAELQRLVSRIRRRVIDELGLSHTVVRNTTDDEMEAVMQEYHRLVAEQERRDNPPDDSEEETTIEVPSTALEQGWLASGRSSSSGSRNRQSVLRAAFLSEDASLSVEEHISGGSLRLWMRGASGRRRRRPARLALYSVAEGGRRRRQLAVQSLPDAAGWVSFNVTELAQQWRAHPDAALRVELRCRRCGRRLTGATARLLLHRRKPRRVRRETSSSSDFLSASKTMRSGSPVDCANSHDKKCCRQKMEVNFKELGGFNQIVAPTAFQAYHCRGGCPASYNVANDHALLQGFIHEKHKQGIKNMPHAHAPCCAPSKLSDLPIAHYDAQGKLRITWWRNVVVDECRCS